MNDNPFEATFSTRDHHVSIKIETEEWVVSIAYSPKVYMRFLPRSPRIAWFYTDPWNPFVQFQLFVMVQQLQVVDRNIFLQLGHALEENFKAPHYIDTFNRMVRFNWKIPVDTVVQIVTTMSYEKQFMNAITEYLKKVTIDPHNAWVLSQHIGTHRLPEGYDQQLLQFPFIMSPSEAMDIMRVLRNKLRGFKELANHAMRFIDFSPAADSGKLLQFQKAIIAVLEKTDWDELERQSQREKIAAVALVVFLLDQYGDPNNPLNVYSAVGMAADWFKRVADNSLDSYLIRHELYARYHTWKKTSELKRILQYGPYTREIETKLLFEGE